METRPRPPPGQKFVDEIVIYSEFGMPKIDIDSWRLTVTGLVNRELRLSYGDILSMPQTKLVADFHCVMGWSIPSLEFEGLRVKYLAEIAGVRENACWVMLECADGYSAPIALEDVLDESSLIVLKMNGKQLSIEHGFPARLFIPHLYAWKSAKWLVKIEFIDSYRDGYWESRGYHWRGNVYFEERFEEKR